MVFLYTPKAVEAAVRTIALLLKGIVQGLIAALFVLPIARLIMGPIEAFTLTNVAEIAAVALLGAAAFSSLGLLLGTAISPQQIGLVFSVIIGPIMSSAAPTIPGRGSTRCRC